LSEIFSGYQSGKHSMAKRSEAQERKRRSAAKRSIGYLSRARIKGKPCFACSSESMKKACFNPY